MEVFYFKEPKFCPGIVCKVQFLLLGTRSSPGTTTRMPHLNLRRGRQILRSRSEGREIGWAVGMMDERNMGIIDQIV